jgi:hypothetical protein
MEKNTKILVGVGVAVAAYFIYMNNRKPVTIPTTISTTEPVKPLKQEPLQDLSSSDIFQSKKVCPAGTTEQVVDCLVAPCETFCVDNNAAYQIEPIFLPLKPTEEYTII